jgi:hypothetical protein
LVLELGRVRIVMVVMVVVILIMGVGMSVLVSLLDGTTRESSSSSLLVLSLDIKSNRRGKVLDDKHGKTRDHHDQRSITGVVIGPSLGETGVGESKEGFGKDVDKGDGEDDTSTKIFAELDEEAGAVVLADDHREDAAEASDDHEDEEGDDMVPDDVFAVVVVVRLACAVGQRRRKYDWMVCC